MPDRYKQFKYNISAIFNSNSDDEVSQEPVEIPSTSITHMIVATDYHKLYTPVIWLVLECPVELLDSIVTHANTASIILRNERVILDEAGDNIIEAGEYIHDEFFYILTENRDVLKDAKYEKDSNEDEPDEIYKQITIGLLKKECVEGNKKIINKIYKNVNVATMLADNVLYRKSIIEPPTNTKIYNQVVIPPILSVNDFIKYIEETYLIYDTPAIFFSDLDRNYILSSEGNPIKASGDEVESIYFNISNPVGIDGKIQGGYQEEEKYMIELDRTDTYFYEDSITDNMYNNILCLDSEGTPKIHELSLKANPESSIKYQIERVRNLDYGKILKHKIESNSIVVRIEKNALNSSLITPNKSFYIYSEEILDNIYNGQYILQEKKETFVRNGEYFENIVSLILKKKP